MLNIHVIGVCLPSQSASEKYNEEKKPIYLCTLREFSKNVSTLSDNRCVLSYLKTVNCFCGLPPGGLLAHQFLVTWYESHHATVHAQC